MQLKSNAIRMKKITLLLIINTFILYSFAQTHKVITVTQADSLINANSANTEFTILDVRSSGEYSTGHIQKALNIDYYSPAFGAKLDTLNKNYIYLVYCKAGGRSTKAIDTMKVLGFNKTYNMLGGIDAWVLAGYQVVTDIKEFYENSIKAEIYPNPASDFVTLDIDEKYKPGFILNIYNLSGALVKTEVLKYNHQQINIGDLSNGIYVVEIKSKGLRGIQKLIIER